MSLVTTKEMFEKAMKEGYAIGAFNVNNMEIIQGIVDAAAEENSPVILQASSSAIKYARINYLMKMIEAAVEEHPDIPIAIGTSHGAYKFKGEAKLRFDILAKIKELIPNTPIVLHGASTVIPELVEMCNKYGADIPGAKGVPDEILNEASKKGVSKINVDTDLRLAMTAQIRKVFAEEPSAFDPRKYLTPARELVKETVAHKMRDVFGSANKA